ncbi:MAG: hypothetical protein JW957_01325 [Candidatus Omnitrophica bacterium]|nr:hypothetical protein [Candidatus Omnitrophota bacterium]
MIEKYLEDLESRIDPPVEDKLLDSWKSFWEGRTEDDIFIPCRERRNHPAVEWPEVSINSALNDYELMALQQFKMCSERISRGSGELLDIRCNYGTGILPSVFGARLFIMDEKMNTLPTTMPLRGGEKEIASLLEKGIPSIRQGLGIKVFECAEKFVDIMRNYPKIKKYVRIFHPDLQGPMDVCELLHGSSIFISLIDKTDLVHRILNLITETYIAFLNEWAKLVPFRDGYSTQWAMLHKGNIFLRDDSAMNLSPEMFEEFIKPYDEKLLAVFDGGGIHFCGRGDHYIEKASKIEKLYAINMSQPHYNDMEKILKNTVDVGIKIIGLRKDSAEELVKKGRDFKKSVQCFDDNI